MIRLTLPLMFLVVVLPAAAQAQTLDTTLYTSPEQREYLDYLREQFLLQNQQNGFDIEENEIPEIPTDGAGVVGPIGPAEYTLSGFMRRSDGSMTIWLNDQHLAEPELPPNATLVREGNSYALSFNTSNGARLLRPGQTLTIENGTVQERFQRPPPAPAATTVAGEATESATDESQDSTAAADESAAEEAVATTEADADATEAADTPDTASLINNLPESIRDNAEQIQSMIETLQSLQESISEVTDPQ